MSLLQFELPVTELMSDEIYNFAKTERNWDFYDYPEDIYLIMKSELNCYCIFRGDWRTNEDHYRMNVQEINGVCQHSCHPYLNQATKTSLALTRLDRRTGLRAVG